MTDAVEAVVLEILRREEGLRLKVYDDATGKPVVPGYTMKGHPTIGIGRALDVQGLTEEECELLLMNNVATYMKEVPSAVPNWARLSTTRKAVLICMAFQMGVPGLKTFKNTLADIGRGDYAAAATRMLQSKWAQQTPARAKRMAELMRRG